MNTDSPADSGLSPAADADRLSNPTGDRVDDRFGYERFHALAYRLRRECPWDIEQTHASLVPYLIEETYEVVDAIAELDGADPSTDPSADAALIEELGDLLYQIEFHAAIAEQAGRFTISDVIDGIGDKLVRRHPHVFADVAVDGSDEVSTNWDAIKRAEKPERQSVFDGIAGSLPGLSYAAETQRKAAKVGFDWPNPSAASDKVTEELNEVAAANDLDDPAAIADEIGDLLFSVVNLARQLGVDPESSLRAATNKFRRRFQTVEASATADGVALDSIAAGEWLQRWEAAKTALDDG